MTISYKSNGVPSISFPTTSHSTTDKIDEFNMNKTWVLLSTSSSSTSKSSTEAACDCLLSLSRLYECMQELINSSSLIPNEKWVEEMMDQLVMFMDVCSILRDLVSQIKDLVRAFQCGLRRRKGDSSVERSISQYNCFRKKVKKEVKGLISSLKQSVVANSDDYHHHDHHEVVIRMVTEVKKVTVSVFESLLMLFVMPNSRTPNASKWSIVVSKLIQKTRVACELHFRATNDFDNFDIVRLDRCVKEGLFSSSYATSCLQGMEAQIERIEGGLECMFRRLIRTRASLLNIVSHY